MKKSLFHIALTIVLLLSIQSLKAQQFNALWATGSAIPNGPQQLTRRPDGQYRFAGVLMQGELKVMTTEYYQEGVTQFLKPQLIDSYLINNGLNYVLTTDASQPGWVVSFKEDTYRFLVDPSNRIIRGELMLPWNELFVAGSAFPGGSNNIEWDRNAMSPFIRDHNNPYVFTWIGELGVYEDVVEPGRFKLEGQMTWGPREMHPFTQDEDILVASQMRQGGDDTKWHVSQKGNYIITVDLFNETIHAELIASTREEETNSIDLPIQRNEISKQTFYDLCGRRISTPKQGIILYRQTDGTIRKVMKR